MSIHSAAVVMVLFFCMLFLSRTRKTYPGFGIWTLSSFFSFAGLLFIGLRGILPEPLSIMLANAFLFSSVWLLSTGMIRFAQLPASEWPHFIAFIACMLAASYFTFIQPSVGHRIILFSAFLALGVVRLVYMLSQSSAPYMKGSRVLILGGCVLGLVWTIIRIGYIGTYHMDSQDFLAASVINGMTLLINSCCYLAIFFGLSALNFQRVEYDLIQARNEVKALKGIIPICCHCKKIRDDKGYWNQVEAYIRDHTDAEFSHGFCPECYTKTVAATPGLADLVFPEGDGDTSPPSKA